MAKSKKTPVKKASKVTKIAAMLRRKNGVTREEVLKATGWTAVSMQQQARAAGLKLRVESPKGKPYIYRAA